MKQWGWLWLPIAFFVMCAGWAVTSPAGSSPDDDFHLASIWCAGGERADRCAIDPQDAQARLVPRDVVGASDCFRFDASVSAACTEATSAELISTIRVNQTAGLYPSGYYRVMGLLVGPDVDRSVLNMRLLNVLIAALVLGAVLALTPRGISGAATIAVTATFIPLGLFIAASTNPSSWTIIGVIGFWALTLAWLAEPDVRSRRGLALLIGTVVTAALAAFSRVDANSYLVLAAIVAVILGIRSREQARRNRGRLMILLGICLLATANYFLVSSASLVIPGLNDADAKLGQNDAGIGLLITNLAYLPVLFQGIVGGAQLGWLDTLMPPFIPVVGMAIVGGLLYRGIRQASRRTLWAALVVALALVAVPILFLQAQHLGVGEVVQPRYLLPLLTLLVATVSVGERFDEPIELPVVASGVIATLLTVSAVLGFWANAQRYLVGSDVPLFDRNLSIEWQPLIGLPMFAIGALTVVATAAFVFGALALFTTVRPRVSEHVTTG